jgi:hypothetical protein
MKGHQRRYGLPLGGLLRLSLAAALQRSGVGVQAWATVCCTVGRAAAAQPLPAAGRSGGWRPPCAGLARSAARA